MDRSGPSFPHVLDPDKAEWSIREIDAAIEMVASGAARSVRLCELPEVESAAAVGLAHAQAAGVPLRFVRDGSAVLLVIGPVVDGEEGGPQQ